MEDLQSTLQSILSDPEQMARVTALAESLGLKPPDPDSAQGEEAATPGIFGPTGGRQAAACDPTEGDEAKTDPRLFASQLGGDGIDLPGLMARLASLNGAEDRVLNALRPSLSREGQGRVDRALRAAKLSRLTGELLKSGGKGRV